MVSLSWAKNRCSCLLYTSKAELVPAVELVPFDPNAEPEPDKPTPVPGTDYHYTRTPANENGWNRGPVEVTFCPGTFDQFHIKRGTDLEATLDAATPQKPVSYTHLDVYKRQL